MPRGPSRVQTARQGQVATAALGQTGCVVVIYDEAPVALVCAPLYICAFEFGQEEEFHDTPSLSDPVRWQMELREGFSSTAPQRSPMLIF